MPEAAPTTPPGLDAVPMWQITTIVTGLLALTGDWQVQVLFLAHLAVTAATRRQRG